MKQDYFTLNKHEILRTIQKYEFLSQEQLKEILEQLKDKSLVSSSLSYNSFLLKLIDKGLIQKSITIRGHIKTRYTFSQDFNIYDFCNSLEKNSFFSRSESVVQLLYPIPAITIRLSLRYSASRSVRARLPTIKREKENKFVLLPKILPYVSKHYAL